MILYFNRYFLISHILTLILLSHIYKYLESYNKSTNFKLNKENIDFQIASHKIYTLFTNIKNKYKFKSRRMLKTEY